MSVSVSDKRSYNLIVNWMPDEMILGGRILKISGIKKNADQGYIAFIASIGQNKNDTANQFKILVFLKITGLSS